VARPERMLEQDFDRRPESGKAVVRQPRERNTVKKLARSGLS
jgi:hypothetical protein